MQGPCRLFYSPANISSSSGEIRWQSAAYLVCHLRHLLGNRAGTRVGRGVDGAGIGCSKNARVGGDCFAEHRAFVDLNTLIVLEDWLYIPVPLMTSGGVIDVIPRDLEHAGQGLLFTTVTESIQ